MDTAGEWTVGSEGGCYPHVGRVTGGSAMVISLLWEVDHTLSSTVLLVWEICTGCGQNYCEQNVAGLQW